MVTQYSILSVLIRPEIQEKISIGLLLFDTNEVYFSFSRNKLHVCKELLSAPSYKILREVIENIEKILDKEKAKNVQPKSFKIYKNDITENIFTAAYISYLSRYSNNILSFTAPKDIYLETTDQNFSSLFKKYVDEIIEAIELPSKLKPVDYIKDQFGNRIKEYYDFNKEITHEQVQNLITPVRVDFAGRNEIDVYVQTVDMEGGYGSVANSINAFVQLKTTYNKNNIPMQDFIIAKEPVKEEYPRQHDMWNQLRTSKILNYLDLSESEEIITYAEQHGVVPLSKSLE
jgi:hypothetical protein